MLQAATRRDGADTDWLAARAARYRRHLRAYNHDEYAASILKPFAQQCTWVVE
jgi:predicted HD phosphohydrolase